MEWYARHYKKLFVIPWIILAICIAYLVVFTAQNGDFVSKGVSLSGGVSATVGISDSVTVEQLEAAVQAQFPQADLEVRSLNEFGGSQTFVVNGADIDPDTQVAADLLQQYLESTYTVTSTSVETTGPSLGDSFFIQTIIGILLAFLWMGWVVYLYFGKNMSMKVAMGIATAILTILVTRDAISGTMGIYILALAVLVSMVLYFITSVPSGAVILAATSTIIFTLAAINLLEVRLSTAGVAAFLMLIGYSVDTDILLSTRVLKEHNAHVSKRIAGAFKTGITMQLTTTAAVFAAFMLSNSEVIRQIMFILLIGLGADIIFTWLQNAGIIYWYVERKGDKPIVEVKAKPKHKAKRTPTTRQAPKKQLTKRQKRRKKK